MATSFRMRPQLKRWSTLKKLLCVTSSSCPSSRLRKQRLMVNARFNRTSPFIRAHTIAYFFQFAFTRSSHHSHSLVFQSYAAGQSPRSSSPANLLSSPSKPLSASPSPTSARVSPARTPLPPAGPPPPNSDSSDYSSFFGSKMVPPS